MTVQYLLPAIWGLVLLISFIGYGALARRLFFEREHFGWANEAAWGMAFAIVLGGAGNSVFLISSRLILIFISAGFALAVADAFHQKTFIAVRFPLLRADIHKHPYAAALKALGYVCIIVLLGIQYLASVGEPSGAYQDDMRGYFTFTKQMLEMGGIALDPFSSYRLGNGLGGQSILHALILVLFDFKNFHLIDGGVAMIICAGLIFRIGEEKKLAYFWRWTLALFFISFPFYQQLRTNSSSLTTGMVMFFALYFFLDRDSIRNETPVRNAGMIAMLAASACALKTNLIPPVAVILFLSYLWYLKSTRLNSKAVIETILVPIFVLLMLMPWMLSLYRSSGTMLYPILGMGFDEYTYGRYLTEDYAGGLPLSQKLRFIYEHFFSHDVFLFLVITGAAAFILGRVKHRAAAHAFSLGSFLAAVLILLKSDISNYGPFTRYLIAGVLTSLVVVLATLMAEVSGRISRRKPRTITQYASALISDAFAAIMFLTILGTAVALYWHYGYARLSLKLHHTLAHEVVQYMGSKDSNISEEQRTRYAKAQESVPAGEAILSRDFNTLLYDYNRNPIYNINDPGLCSPPPGMPYFQGPEAVAAYLLSFRIRYVAYAYATQAGYPVIKNLWRHRPDRPYVHRIGERAKVALDRVLGELGASRTRVYDDGSLFILDLQARSPKARIYREPNYFQTGKILVLAWAHTQGFDANKVWTNGHGVIDDILYKPDKEDAVLVLNTFGYHPWKDDINKINLSLSVNGTKLPFMKHSQNGYFFSLAQVRRPITRITIDSSTFVPREENVLFGMDDDRKTLGIDVDTIQIISSNDQRLL